MPTGYTADVCDGKITDFKDFAIRCARNFGACVMMREDPLDAPIPEAFQPSDYYQKALEKNRAALDRLVKMTSQECDAEERKERGEALHAHQTHADRCKAIRERLLAMRSRVADWTPPTSDHEGLKKFMIQQLDETLKYDGQPGTFYLDKASIRTGEEWRSDRIKELKHDIVYHTEEHRKEVERTNMRNTWVDQLRASLKA